ncbi:dihydrodipicolinate synthase family protein [Uliginosibacterium gangwonense]|uniref:dihydrodipicolinate synthase family protein n=1 Tax=Uliginosibacterium gangwonense TaxID=392736 RepID=UPI000369A061|nr:dihydrodipicolinate synthase family protein [Uliginosibacterium gangwonense]
MSKKVQGVLTAIVTPFNPQGEVCEQRLRKQIQRQLAHDNGIFCNGTNGEFFVLDMAEKIRVTGICVDEVAGRVPVVAHIGEISTAATIRLGKEAARLGVDAVSAITPYFVPLKQSEVIAHYTAVADAVPVPVYLYNIPGRTGNTIEPETARKLAEHPNIIGIKDSAGSYESLQGFLAAVKGIEGFDVLSGPDHLAYRGFVEGCCACISGLANVQPEGVSRIWKNFHAGDLAKAEAAQEFIAGLRKELYAVAFSPAAVKKAVVLLGDDVGESRYPIHFSAQDLATIQAIAEKYRHCPVP